MRSFLCAVVVALVVGGCSSKPPPATSASDRAATTVVTAPIAFTVRSFPAETGTTPPDPSEMAATQAAVLSTLGSYLDQGVITPLRTGSPAGDLAPLFSTLAVARGTSAPDRSGLFDEGLPAVADVRADTADLDLTGLAGLDGHLVAVNAHMTLRLTGTVSGTPFLLARTGEIVLVPEAGAWKIDSYDLRVSRDAPPSPTAPPAAPVTP